MASGLKISGIVKFNNFQEFENLSTNVFTSAPENSKKLYGMLYLAERAIRKEITLVKKGTSAIKNEGETLVKMQASLEKVQKAIVPLKAQFGDLLTASSRAGNGIYQSGVQSSLSDRQIEAASKPEPAEKQNEASANKKEDSETLQEAHVPQNLKPGKSIGKWVAEAANQLPSFSRPSIHCPKITCPTIPMPAIPWSKGLSCLKKGASACWQARNEILLAGLVAAETALAAKKISDEGMENDPETFKAIGTVAALTVGYHASSFLKKAAAACWEARNAIFHTGIVAGGTWAASKMMIDSGWEARDPATYGIAFGMAASSWIGGIIAKECLSRSSPTLEINPQQHTTKREVYFSHDPEIEKLCLRIRNCSPYQREIEVIDPHQLVRLMKTRRDLFEEAIHKKIVEARDYTPEEMYTLWENVEILEEIRLLERMGSAPVLADGTTLPWIDDIKTRYVRYAKEENEPADPILRALKQGVNRVWSEVTLPELRKRKKYRIL